LTARPPCGRLSGMDNGLRWYEANKGRYGDTTDPAVWETKAHVWKKDPAVVRENEDFVTFAQGWHAACQMGIRFEDVFLDQFKRERTMFDAFRALRRKSG